MGFRIVDTTADVGIEAWSEDLKGLFENAARGLFALIADVDKVDPVEEINYRSEGIDLEDTLISMLNDLIYLSDAKGILFKDIEIKNLSDKCVEFVAKGERYNPEKHGSMTEIKAATYHNIKIAKDGNLYRVRVVFDV